ncbi:MAG: hypothetical protein P8Y44_04485, partial [Acidobacteriota bacterium]
MYLAALVVGIETGLSLRYCATSLVAALLGLSLTLGPKCRLLSWTALGLLLGGSQPTVSYQPDPHAPVTLSGRLQSDWRATTTHYRARFSVETLAQQRVWRVWRHEVFLNLPLTVAPPRSKKLRVVGYLRRAPPLSNGPHSASRPWSLWIRSRQFIHQDQDPLP